LKFTNLKILQPFAETLHQKRRRDLRRKKREIKFSNEENKVKMRNKLMKMGAVFIAMFIVLLVADTANAQTRRGRAISKQQMEQLLERIEERTDKFSNQLNKSLDRSRLDGGRTEDNIAERASELENSTDELRREFDHNDTKGENKPEARKILRAATLVNRIMNRRNFSRQAENSWITLRAELNALARIYGLPTVGARSYR